MIACARSYRETMRDFAGMNVLEHWYARLEEADYQAMLPDARKTLAAQTDRQGDCTQQRGVGVSEAGRNHRRAAAHP